MPPDRPPPDPRADDAATVLVLRALRGLGDLICGVPALRALRRALPAAHVTVVAAPGTEWFAETFAPYVDDTVVLRGWPGIPEAPGSRREAVAQLAELQRAGYDLALQLHGDDEIANVWIDLVAARRTAVMTRPGRWVPDGAAVAVVEPPDNEVDRMLDVLRAAGLPATDRHLEFPADRTTVPSDVAMPERYVVLHPGSSTASRRWPASAFAATASALAKRGIGTVLTGVAAERDVAEQVRACAGTAVVDLVGRTSVGEAAGVVAGAIGAVTNDTGMSHLAAAVGRPSVVLFQAKDHRRWLPPGGTATPLGTGAPVGETVAQVVAAVDGWTRRGAA
jgi:ADP-heptose:LPS heptosyltransferase